MIVCDASFLIGLTDERDAHNERAIEIAAGGQRLITSVVTLAEALAGPASKRRETYLLEVAQLEPLAVPDDAGPRLAELRRSTGLKMPDCLVVELAERRTVPIATYDQPLAKAAATRGISVLE